MPAATPLPATLPALPAHQPLPSLPIDLHPAAPAGFPHGQPGHAPPAPPVRGRYPAALLRLHADHLPQPGVKLSMFPTYLAVLGVWPEAQWRLGARRPSPLETPVETRLDSCGRALPASATLSTTTAGAAFPPSGAGADGSGHLRAGQGAHCGLPGHARAQLCLHRVWVSLGWAKVEGGSTKGWREGGRREGGRTEDAPPAGCPPLTARRRQALCYGPLRSACSS